MKKMQILLSIIILLTLLFPVIVFAEDLNAESNPSMESKITPTTIVYDGVMYHLYDPSNVKTLTANGKTYVRIQSYESSMALPMFLIIFMVLAAVCFYVIPWIAEYLVC